MLRSIKRVSLRLVYNGQNPHKLTLNNCIYLYKICFPEEKATDTHDSDDTAEPLIFLASGSFDGVRKPRLESGHSFVVKA